jgi:hypothetical protein
VEVLSWIRRQGGTALLALGLLLIAAGPAWAAPTENEVKAAYLFNFARYVTWPKAAFASSKDPIRICILEDAEFRDVLSKTVSGKRVSDRSVVAETRGGVEESSGCHILFVKSRDASEVSSLASSSIFTVSDGEGFAVSGGMANFVRSGSKVRFEINPGAVQKAGLQVSSRLLRLAQIVE